MPETTHRLAEADWLLELAASCPFGAADRLGTANYLDGAARRRAVAASESGAVVSLARPLADGAALKRVGVIKASHHFVDTSMQSGYP